MIHNETGGLGGGPEGPRGTEAVRVLALLDIFVPPEVEGAVRRQLHELNGDVRALGAAATLTPLERPTADTEAFVRLQQEIQEKVAAYRPLVEAHFELSVREVEVLRFATEGLSNGQIATRLFLSEHTVKTHFRRISKVMNVRGRAAVLNIYNGHVPLPGKNTKS